jgi:hypothetical protein
MIFVSYKNLQETSHDNYYLKRKEQKMINKYWLLDILDAHRKALESTISPENQFSEFAEGIRAKLDYIESLYQIILAIK